MKRVRCPACAQLHLDPATTFACSGCGANLRWAGETPAWVGQLPLFELLRWRQDELQLTAADSTGTAGAPAVGPTRTGVTTPRPTPTGFQEAISLVAAMCAGDDPDIAPAIADVLTGRSSEDLARLVLSCTAISAELVSAIDGVTGGEGTRMLQAWALGFAQDAFD